MLQVPEIVSSAASDRGSGMTPEVVAPSGSARFTPFMNRRCASAPASGACDRQRPGGPTV